MTTEEIPTTTRPFNYARLLRALLPALSLALVLLAIAWLNPRAISYLGFTLMLNLASFGPDQHQLMIQADIEGLHDILELSLEEFRDRTRAAAAELDWEPPTDLTIEGWWDQARTLEDE